MRLEAKSGVQIRTSSELQWRRSPGTTRKATRDAWSRLLGDAGRVHVAWDRATGVAGQVVLSGVTYPGSVDQAEVAEEKARAFLARHLELLAPGSQATDFKLVANRLQGTTRVVGFAQTHQGIPVIGGQIGFRFKGDNLILVTSQAAARLAVPRAAFVVSDSVAEERALDWIAADFSPNADNLGSVSGPVILPLVGPNGVIDTREVRIVTVESTAPIGRWEVFVDATTGEPVARRQTLMFGQGTVLYETPIRGPHSTRANYPGSHANQVVDGLPALSDSTGLVSWAGGAPGSVQTNLEGPYVRMVNEAGDVASSNVTVSDGGSAVWADASELVSAQLTTFAHTNVVNDYVRNIDPSFAWLDEQINGVVNISDACNAYSDGHNIHFFQSGGGCANTGELPDVVYHEFGHSVHSNVIIPGVGAFNGALSEGVSDYLAATIVDDSGMGRGFFQSDEPLRELDPEGYEWHWPEDTGEVHYEGQIIGGTLWDLREMLRAKLGDVEGIALTDKIFLEGISRAVNIPTMYMEALVTDDNDGDLTNGTPNVCDINKAFGDHGLRTLSADISDIGRVDTAENDYEIQVLVDGLIFPQCGDMLGNAVLEWKLRGQGGQANSVPMSADGLKFAATIPKQAPNTVVQYRVSVELTGVATQQFPQNRADPWFEFYVGDVIPLYCTGFEDAGQGWGAEGAWQVGKPIGAGGDPEDARGGEFVLGTVLGGTGMYPAFSTGTATSPTVDTLDYDVVRLQYRRWLRVEDSFYDTANIRANGTEAWINLETGDGTTHHLDHQWRFHDVDLSSYIQGGQVQLQFGFESDAGLEFGGWNVDDLCVVAVGDVAPNNDCGNGVIEEGEICDDGPGNSASQPNACRPDCTPAACGDNVVDAGEMCDDGNLWGGDGCSANCEVEGGSDSITGGTAGPGTDSSDGTETGDTDTDTGDLATDMRGCGCRSGNDNAPAGMLAFGLLLLGLRRKRGV